MSNLAPPPLAVTSSDAFGGRRVTFEDDSLFVQARDNIIGTYQPVEEIFWEEVEGVYLWRSPDWSMVLPGTVLAFLAVLLVRVILAFFVETGLADVLMGFAALLLFLLVLVIAIRYSPRSDVRVVGNGREIRFYTSDPKVLAALFRHLNLPGEVP
jgi:hypothetical protein